MVLGIGAWFKPLFFPRFSFDYNEDMQLKYQVMIRHLFRYRKYIEENNPKAQILWRNNPHVGNYDELKFFTGASFNNEGIHHIAKKHGDLLINLHDVSILSLKYFEPFLYQYQDFKVHVDSLDYCPGGVFRGGLLLLETALELYHHSHFVHLRFSQARTLQIKKLFSS